MFDPLSLTRPRRALRSRCLIAVAAVLLAGPATPASADTFTDVYKDFAKDGAVDPCAFTAKQLRSARSQVTPDLEQYAPDFPAALDLAIEARANGACKKKASTTGKEAPAAVAPTPSSGDTGGGSAPATPTESPAQAPAAPAAPAATPVTETPQPAPVPAAAPAAADGAVLEAAKLEPTSGPSDGLPAAVVGLGTLAALLLATSLIWLMLRTLAWEPTWFPRARHAFHEAGWRASGTWQDFTDWVRLGR